MRPSHYAEAIFNDACNVLGLEDALNDWIIMVNRSYLGQTWHTPALRHRGMIIFLEPDVEARSNKRYAFLLLRQPRPAEADEFAVRAASLFRNTDASGGLTREIKLAPIVSLGANPETISGSFVSRMQQD